jgi:hypothetical protein
MEYTFLKVVSYSSLWSAPDRQHEKRKHVAQYKKYLMPKICNLRIKNDTEDKNVQYN